MTDDELDLLASAYLDGEATSEEVAMVERDPQLLARVEALRSVSEQVAAPVTSPSAEVKEQHLAAALAAFNIDLTADAESSEQAAPVIDLTERASRPRSATRSTTRETPTERRKTMPRWLPAAAALLLFGGAGAIIASQGLGGDDDATEAASMEADTAEDESAEEADFDAASESRAVDGAMADDAGEAEAMELEAEDAMEEEEAMEDDEAMEDEAADSATESAPVAEDSEGGFFPEDPVLTFAAAPDPNQVLRDTEPELRFDVSQAQCGEFAAPLTDGEVLGYLPVEVAGEPAEFFVLTRENGTDSAVILSAETCQLLTP